MQLKKKRLEEITAEKVRFDFERRNLNERMIKHLKKLLEQKEYIEYWTVEFIKMIAVVSIVSQIHYRYTYLRNIIERSKKRFAVTLFAINQVQTAVESKGPTHQIRTLAESKM